MTCCALARPSNAVPPQGTACSTTECLKPKGCVAELTLTPMATKLSISAQEQQYSMVQSSGELQMPWHGLAAQAGWMELCLSAKLHQTLSHCQAAHTDREWFYCSHPVPTQTEFIIIFLSSIISEQSHKALQLLPAVKFALVHASPHALRALQLDLLQQSSRDTHRSFASAPEEGLLQARMLSVAPAPGHAQQVLPPGGKTGKNSNQRLERDVSYLACRNGAGYQPQWGISTFQMLALCVCIQTPAAGKLESSIRAAWLLDP